MDRETIAEVVGSLPADSQQRWYHRKGGRGEAQLQKGCSLLAWLEEERADAVAIHLDTLARKAKPAASHPTTAKSALPAGGTDQPIYAGSHATLQSLEERSDVQVHAGGSLASGGDAPNGGRRDRVDVTTAQQAKEVADKRKTNLEAKKLDKCPMCKSQHNYEKTWTQTTPQTVTEMVSTLLTSCPKFLAQSPDQKMVSITSHATCPHCTSWEHARHRYGGRELPEPKCKTQVQGVECGGKHCRWYHATSGTTGNMVAAPATQTEVSSTPGLYEVYSAEFETTGGGEGRGTVMVDNGSDTNYICHDFAASLGLVGEAHQCRIKVVDMDYRTVNTARYTVRLVDTEGEVHGISALGLASITTLPPDPDLSPLLPLLGDVPDAVLERPQGRVDVLVGLRNSSLHGKDVCEWGNLRLLKAKLGCGWAIRGTHESLQFSATNQKPSYSAELHAIRNADVEVPDNHGIFHVVTSLEKAAEFHELAELGTTPVPACERCAGCTDCTFRRTRLSREDQEVVNRIEASLQVDEITGQMSGTYPWKPCVERMRSNLRQAMKIQTSVEQHMVKAGTHSGFVEEVEKSIVDGRVREISEGEMEKWHGPVHYVTVFAVVKPGSLSTQTRVVSNSALKNAVTRLSLNDCMHPGPNALAALLDCLIFWRGVEVAVMMDMRKAYQAIHTSTMELHLRRFLYRPSPTDPWKTYGYT